MAVWPLGKESSQGPAATAATYAPPRHRPRAILIINGPIVSKITRNHLPDQWKSTFHRNPIEKTLPLRLGHSTRTTLSPCFASLVGRCYGRRRVCPTVSLTHSLSLVRARALGSHTRRTRTRPDQLVPHLRMRTSISRTNIVSVPRAELHRHFPGVSYNRMAFRAHDDLGSRN